MKEITEQEKLDNQKSELIDDLIATATVKEEFGDTTQIIQIEKML